MNLCVIPARGGSKRIPRKNIKEFNGKPIIQYSIEAAQKSECFDMVVVSTDDDEIAEIALSLGAQVPFTRPGNLSNDHATTVPVIKHAIDWFENKGQQFDYVCCIYPTAPLIKPEFIIKAYNELIESNADYCFTATDYPAPIQRAFKVDSDHYVEMFQPECYNMRSQDLQAAFHDAGQFYWGKPQAYQNELPFYSKKSKAMLIPRYFVQDIDNDQDWKRAELMYSLLKETAEI